MNAEFEALYNEWKCNTMFLSCGLHENEWWDNLVKWSEQHKQEAKDGLIEILKREPDHVVFLCSVLWGELDTHGYIPFEPYCNLWLNILEGKNDFRKDHYKDYRKWKKHLDEYYIPWNPFVEGDPNVTLEEFQQGKRNDKNHPNRLKYKAEGSQEI